MVERKFFGNCQKNFGRAAKTGFHTNISQKNTDSEKSLFHLNFGHRAEQFLPFVDVFQGGVVKVTFYVSFGKFWGIFLIFFFLSLSVKDTDWKKIRLFLKNISTKFSKLHSRCPRENIGEIFFIQNFVFFILFGQWAKSCRSFDKFFMAEFWKLHSTCPQKQFENFFAKKKLIFHHFWTLIGKIYASFLKSFGGVVKTAFHLSTGTFRGVFLEKVLFHHFWTLLESC